MGKKIALYDPKPGDVVRVDGETTPWRVTGKDRKGILTLVSLHRTDRIVWDGVHEFRVERAGVFS